MSPRARKPTPPPLLRDLAALAADPVERARERFAIQDYAGAAALLEDAIDAGCHYADAYNLLGLSLALLDRPHEALAALDRALVQNPRYLDAHLNRGVLLTGLGRSEAAAAAFAHADELGQPDHTGLPITAANRIANAHAHLGDEYRAAGAAPQAIAQYRRALELRPAYVDIRLVLAHTLLEAERYADAADALDQILVVQPHQLDALLLRGLAAYLQGAVGTAEQMWDRAAELHPDDGRVEGYRSMVKRQKAGDAGAGYAGAGGRT
jgi:tetratricopeptide (TPR) repeat protein